MIENWKDIPGYEGVYQVSDIGQVRNAHGHVLSSQLQNSGYLVCHLYKAGARRVRLVHRLVADVFCEDGLPSLEVNHINGVKLDNRSVNLEWVTRVENVRHAHAAGLVPPPRRNAVVGHSVDDGHEVTFPSQLAAEVSITGRASSAIHHCLAGKKKSAYGYVWRRA